ncbi:hypothetical protein ACEPAI_9624 [Sanghuangporus weigelae]
MINLEARSVENINTGSTSLDHCGIAKPLEEERKSNRDDCNTNAACCVLNQLPYKLYRRISGVIRSNDLKLTEDAHRTVFLIIIESDQLRHSTRQATSPFAILRNTLAPGGLTRTCAYLCHDKVAHVLTVGSPVERGARVHGETVLYPLEQDRKGMLLSKATWNADWYKLQWNVFGHEQIAIESTILVAKKVIPEGPSSCVYLEAIDRTLYRNASGRRTCTAERLLDDTDRMSRLVLLDLLYTHLHMVEDEKILRQCFRHIFEAHYRVYDATGVLHRDINIDNLMVRMGRDGSKQGVLIDWDLASRVIDEQDHTGTRTGTRAFMAYELFLENASKHILRFDWESFLYHLMWAVFVMIDEDYRTTETKRIKDETNEKPDTLGSSMVRWPKLNDEKLRLAKAFAISTKGKYMYSRSVHKFHSTFSTWINPIWELFIRGDEARMKGDPTFDYETLGNRLTYTGLHDILDRESSQSITERH